MFTCAKSRTNFRYFNIMNNDFGKESDGLPMQTVVICFLWWFVLFLVRRSAERKDKKVIELRTEVEKLEQITQHLDERRKQQERIINDFDPDTLKCKSADLLEEIRKSENKLCELRNVKAKLSLEVSGLKIEKEKLSEKLVAKSSDVDERKRLMRI